MRTLSGSAPPDPTMTRRHELSDSEWAEIASFFPADGKRGGRFGDHRTLVNGVFWRLRTGAPWRDVPERYGPWETVYGLFRRWQRDGTWHRMFEQLQARADAEGLITWDVSVDSTIARAHQHAAGARKKCPYGFRQAVAAVTGS